jgi:DNA modification methylase
MWFVKDNNEFIWNKENQYSEEKYDPAWAKRLGKEYKRFSNIWSDIKEETLSGIVGVKDIIKKDKIHFTPKPEKSIERIILAHTKNDDIILDCFMGSGTTAVVAKKLNRNFIGCDNNQEFVDFGNERVINE